MKDLVVQLRLTPEFQVIMAEMLKSRPVIPRYVPCETHEQRAALMEQIRAQTMKQDGFDLLFKLLTGSNP